ncbi:MAG: hypothetical protein E6R14_06980 [Thermomicrobiales bacterium]|nr:MAG: hypothetical protein E6R14_06980 [Thermomicrobiales bacterium]
MSDQREIIEVEDYRVIDVREEPIDDTQMPPAQSAPPPQFSGRVYTSSGGGGCCLGLSATLLVIGIIFVLGLCAFVMLIARLVGWAIPGL